MSVSMRFVFYLWVLIVYGFVKEFQKHGLCPTMNLHIHIIQLHLIRWAYTCALVPLYWGKFLMRSRFARWKVTSYKLEGRRRPGRPSCCFRFRWQYIEMEDKLFPIVVTVTLCSCSFHCWFHIPDFMIVWIEQVSERTSDYIFRLQAG